MTLKVPLFLAFISISALPLRIFGSECIDNVEQQLSQLQSKKPILTKIVLNLDSNKYTQSPLNFFGIHNHFQGIATKDDFLFISGGDKYSLSADLFVFENFQGHFKLIDTIQVNKEDTTLWHAGALRIHKDQLYIPIERLSSPLNSKVLSYDLRTQKFSDYILIDYNKTGAIDIFDLDSEETMVLFDTKEISFINLLTKKTIKRIPVEIFEGSSAFVLNDCNHKIYIAILSNTGLLSPIINGKDIIKLYELDTHKLKTKFLKEFSYNCSQCNLRGASSIDIINGKIRVISTPMYRPLFEDHFYLETFI